MIYRHKDKIKKQTAATILFLNVSVFSGWRSCCSTGGIRRTNNSSFSASTQGVTHVDSLGVLQNLLLLSHTWGSSGHGQLIWPSRTHLLNFYTTKMWEEKERLLEPSNQALWCKSNFLDERQNNICLPSFNSIFLTQKSNRCEETTHFTFKFS